jgi:hypothetical protein
MPKHKYKVGDLVQVRPLGYINKDYDAFAVNDAELQKRGYFNGKSKIEMVYEKWDKGSSHYKWYAVMSPNGFNTWNIPEEYLRERLTREEIEELLIKTDF